MLRSQPRFWFTACKNLAGHRITTPSSPFLSQYRLLNYSRSPYDRNRDLVNLDRRDLRTSLRAVKGPIFESSAIPVRSCDLSLQYNYKDSGLALSRTLLDIQGRPDLLLRQFQRPLEGQREKVSIRHLAWTLAARYFDLSPAVSGCLLTFHHPLDVLLKGYTGEFSTRYSFTQLNDRSLRLIRSTRINLAVVHGQREDVILFLTNRPEFLSQELDKNEDSPYSGPVQLQFKAHESDNDLRYEAAVARELLHHIPLHIGKPTLAVQEDLKSMVAKASRRIAPKDHWEATNVKIPYDSLYGSRFGLDQNMEYSPVQMAKKESISSINIHRAVIALGSNIGDRVKHIEDALQEMENRGLAVQLVSPLYETKAMYVLDQEAFLNGACEIQTVLPPIQLLNTLQDIEKSLGRIKLIDKGPRNIDLDILLYDEERIDHERLVVPHKLMLEREFVLQPLSVILPNRTLPTPNDSLSFRTHLLMLKENTTTEPRPLPVVQVNQNFPLLKPHQDDRRTHVMAILNVTPDSFSDGGMHSVRDAGKMAETVRQYIKSGAAIIDVGGQSTRPNATLISAKEEINRVIPVIQLIRSLPEAKNVAISVDTFYARVAKAAVDAGADMINDISGGTMDPDMFPTVASLHKTIVISHTRGDPSTMTKLTSYEDGVVAGVGEELASRIQEAQRVGIRPWRIILDPGIGFAKNQDQNLELLRDFASLRGFEELRHYPWLIGTSRKKFVGTITGVEQARDRIFGTAATVVAGVREGADIVRVHDVKEMSQVVKMSDAIYRVKAGPRQPLSSSTKTSEEMRTRADARFTRPTEVKADTDLQQLLEYEDIKDHPFYRTLLGNDAIATDGLNTSGEGRRK